MSRQKKHIYQITTPGEILPGSISMVFLACGKKNCACTGKEPKLHGPYYRWTGLINNKRTTVTLSESDAKEAQKRNDNYKKFMEKIDLIKEKALKNAPWIKTK